MIRPRSNISASLHKKRQASLLRRCIYYTIFILFFVSLGILGLTTKEVKITKVVVTGNSSVPTADITKIIENEMNKVYLWIIPTDNLLLLRGKEIKNNIMDSIKEIGSVRVLVRGVDKIEINVTERVSKDLWCKGTPAKIGSCYFMDADGFIFEEAPSFSDDSFPEYFGLITEENPIGLYYIKNKFIELSSVFGLLKRMSFWPRYFNTLNEHEYEVYILGGGKILMNDTKSFESELTNLQALVDNGYLKTDSDSLKKIKYVDLRFGNKINFELSK